MTTRVCVVIATALAGAQLLCAQSPFPKTCPAGKPYPFASIAVTHPIDSTCGISGHANRPQETTQDKVKNQLCLDTSSIENIELASLISLQKPSQPQGEPPVSRSSLTKSGEGKLVRAKGYLIDAHHADLDKGESVNCGQGESVLGSSALEKAEESNDVHIALAPAADTQLCKSVTAEISPHYRPASWNNIGLAEVWAGHKYVPTALDAVLKKPVYRITGQRFYDASHKVCPCGQHCPGQPVRATNWEIHPVYNVEVCKDSTGNQCDVANDSNWQSFDDWWKKLNPSGLNRHTHP